MPCGREKTAKPPKCKRLCQVPTKCHHESSTNLHNCHFGPCPKCREACAKTLTCGHICQADCHENVKTKVEDKSRPSLPWEVKGPQFVVTSQPCPPCDHPVDVTCLGAHETVAYPCHMAKSSNCGRKCGRSLPCGNHTCVRDCHKVRGADSDVTAGVNCKKCEAECSKPRPKGCSHPCTIGKCHPGQCPDCVTNIKMKCHCGLANIFVKCFEYLSSDKEQREILLCCKDQCPQQLDCGHRCSQTCHTGKCSLVSDCKKKVKVSCKCKRKKEEFKCNQAFMKEGLVPCDEICAEANKKLKRTNNNVSTKETEEELRNRKEAELFERQLAGGKKKRKPRHDSHVQENKSLLSNKTLLFGSLAFGLVSIVMYVAFMN